MSEQETSNERFNPANPHEPFTPAWHAWAEGVRVCIPEIDRLTANLEAGAASYKRMEAERDRLIAERDYARSLAREGDASLIEEVSRLRAALQEIADTPVQNTMSSRQETSNPLVHELREMARQLEIEVSASMADDVVQAADEIERLTAERDRAVEAVAREGRHARRVEINRLRAALEMIASGSLDKLPPFRAAPHDALRRYAQKALAGAPDEPDGYSHTASGETVGHSQQDEPDAGIRKSDPPSILKLDKYRVKRGWWIFRWSAPQCTSQFQMLPKDRDAWYCCRRHAGHLGRHTAWTGERW